MTKLLKMIVLKMYRRDNLEQYWKQKLGIDGNFSIQIINAITFERYQKVV
ncbi:MAG TPA: hypothetical protein QF571_03870 [Desulfobacterales bacterium]|nr:hypothetical protein [Desulfobacterales bacterium]HJO61948.1 hypothetical protein [Desulfobacterales bacterium]